MRKIFTKDTSDEGLILKKYKELIKLNTEKMQTVQLQNVRGVHGHFSKESVPMVSRQATMQLSQLMKHEIDKTFFNGIQANIPELCSTFLSGKYALYQPL